MLRILIYVLFWLIVPVALGQRPPARDASPVGPVAVGEGTYDVCPVAGACGKTPKGVDIYSCTPPLPYPNTPAAGTNLTPCAAFDPTVLPGCIAAAGFDCKIEIKAEIYYPQGLSAPAPLIVFLHGNHNTCATACKNVVNPCPYPGNPHIDNNSRFTGRGTCPAKYGEVPSYLGYAYLANRLASWGYIVISIDANRGVTGTNAYAGATPADPSLILARGQLVLRNLQELSRWNTNGGTPSTVGIELQNLIDFQNVGVIGHSRGGEGVRAAYNLYTVAGSPWPGRAPGVRFKGVYELAPTDTRDLNGLRTPDPNAKGVAWNVLLPMCDGDLINLPGMRPFDRMLAARFGPFELLNPTPKSTYAVWGANHNFYNTEWQISDNLALLGITAANACVPAVNSPMYADSPDSPTERLTSLSSVPAFFRANVGATADPTFDQNFNTLFSVPPNVTDDTPPPGGPIVQPYPRRVDRGYTPSPSALVTTVFEDFNRATGFNSYGPPNQNNNIAIAHVAGITGLDDTSVQRVADISWPMAGGAGVPFFQTNWTAANAPGRSTNPYKTLDFRVSRQPTGNVDTTPTDFSIQLVGANGVLTNPVRLSSYLTLLGPVGVNTAGGGLINPVLQTVRIPLQDFGNYVFIAPQVMGVLFTFDQTASGAIYLANVRLARTLGSGQAGVMAGILTGEGIEPQAAVPAAQAGTPAIALHHTGVIRSIKPWTTSIAGAAALYAIEIYSDTPFPVRNEMSYLRAGSERFLDSLYPDGDPHTVVFLVSREALDRIANGTPATVEYGLIIPDSIWDLGGFDTTLIQR